MNQGAFPLSIPQNEPVLPYAPGSPERRLLKSAIAELKKKKADVPMYIGSEEVRTGRKVAMRPPHETSHLLGHFHEGDASHVKKAIEADRTLGGVVNTCRVTEARNYVSVNVGDTTYLQIELEVEVVA